MPRSIPEHARQRQTYSIDLRKRVIYQKYTLNKKIPEIVLNLDISQRVVERTLQLWRDTGEVVSQTPGKKSKRRRVMIPDEINFLIALIQRHPEMYLDEMQTQLQQKHGVIVGISTIWDTLTELGLSRKKLSKAAAERNAAARARYEYLIGDESPERLVFVDESRIDCRTTYRMYGWAYKGQRALSRARFVRGQGYSLLPALSTEGIIYSDIHEGSYNGRAFVQYVENLMSHMNPWPAPCSVLVMDNCAIHHHPDIEPICEARGVRLYYLPPYSPDYNPIEELFSFVKSILRRDGPEFRAAFDSKDMDEVEYVLLNALGSITPEKAQGWFHHSGYL